MLPRAGASTATPEPGKCKQLSRKVSCQARYTDPRHCIYSRIHVLHYLRQELRQHLGACAPSYAGPQLARAEGAPDELTPEDVDAFGLQGCAYMRGVSESLEWARPLGEPPVGRASPTGQPAEAD